MAAPPGRVHDMLERAVDRLLPGARTKQVGGLPQQGVIDVDQALRHDQGCISIPSGVDTAHREAGESPTTTKRPARAGRFMERTTGFEPATLTLARP